MPGPFSSRTASAAQTLLPSELFISLDSLNPWPAARVQVKPFGHRPQGKSNGFWHISSCSTRIQYASLPSLSKSRRPPVQQVGYRNPATIASVYKMSSVRLFCRWEEPTHIVSSLTRPMGLSTKRPAGSIVQHGKNWAKREVFGGNCQLTSPLKPNARRAASRLCSGP